LLLLLQEQTQDMMPIANTSDPSLFFNMSSLDLSPKSTLVDHGIRRHKGFLIGSFVKLTID